jgi:hypothetical protein
MTRINSIIAPMPYPVDVKIGRDTERLVFSVPAAQVPKHDRRIVPALAASLVVISLVTTLVIVRASRDIEMKARQVEREIRSAPTHSH